MGEGCFRAEVKPLESPSSWELSPIPPQPEALPPLYRPNSSSWFVNSGNDKVLGAADPSALSPWDVTGLTNAEAEVGKWIISCFVFNL
ncbi:hypothetical protein chiPu_0001224 [Chiloscyllium punctatum]|uniref:Uncharacterized protein n=1 Tax=Chiloscyllium punctatum TaxID=137246 RepID=A0A401RXE9_CHIPU|nr:hypothetical protein [Chiloscyllium punctatum]